MFTRYLLREKEGEGNVWSKKKEKGHVVV